MLFREGEGADEEAQGLAVSPQAPYIAGGSGAAAAGGTRDGWESWSETPLRGAEPRGKTQRVFEANIWTISRLCLNEASTANSRSRREKQILLPCAD